MWSILLAYLAGSVPFAFLLARRAGLDVRFAGSGNVAAALPTWPYATCDWIERMFMAGHKTSAAGAWSRRAKSSNRFW